jgi:hypothetical protein
MEIENKGGLFIVGIDYVCWRTQDFTFFCTRQI